MKYMLWIMRVNEMNSSSPRCMGEFSQESLDRLMRNATLIGKCNYGGHYDVYAKPFGEGLNIIRVEKIRDDDPT